MEFFGRPLTLQEIKKLQEKWGDYLKLTVDIGNGWLVAGGELHADGEKLLLDKGSKQDDIWGGGINLSEKEIDATAVINLRPGLNSDSMEILDPQRRGQFLGIAKKFFKDYGIR